MEKRSSSFIQVNEMRVRTVPNDNNCLFSAIGYLCSDNNDELSVSLGITTSQNALKPYRLRQTCADIAASNPDVWGEAMLGRANFAYTKWILDQFNWGGENEIVMLSGHLHVEIVVVSLDGFVLSYGNPLDASCRGRIYVVYTGQHYDALVGIRRNDFIKGKEVKEEEVRLFPPGDSDSEQLAKSTAEKLKAEHILKQSQRIVKKIKCLGCGAIVDDAQGFQSHCMTVEHNDDFAYDCEEVEIVESKDAPKPQGHIDLSDESVLTFYNVKTSPLSNLYPSSITIATNNDNVALEFQTVEHYCMFTKFQKCDPKHAESIRTASVEEAHARGNMPHPSLDIKEWDEIREQCLLKGLKAKFSQNEELKKVLLATSGKTIVNIDLDPWGGLTELDGVQKGDNKLGKLLEMASFSLALLLPNKISPLNTTAERRNFLLEKHATDPWPKDDTNWGNFNLVLARLALLVPNASAGLDNISKEIESWAAPDRIPRVLPLDDYSVNGPCAGLGELPVLHRMALLPKFRNMLSEGAKSSLDKIFFAWLSTRSKVAWASASDSWTITDGSENLDITRKTSLYLSALALNISSPSKRLELDGETVAEHAAAWEDHFKRYLHHRAIEGIGVEMGSPTYGKYTLQNLFNLVDLAPGVSPLASNFLNLWFADAAQSFLPAIGVRGGAHNRVYRNAAFFSSYSDDFRTFSWLYGWWKSEDLSIIDNMAMTPQATLAATSIWEPLPIISALAQNERLSDFLYISRRLGDVSLCSQTSGPLDPRGTTYHNVTCTKTPCKPCLECGNEERVLAFEGSDCNTLKLPTTVVKEEYIGKGRKYTLGAIRLDQSEGTNYGADVGQNHQVGLFCGEKVASRVIFGDSGSSNCSSLSFQRHSFNSITSHLDRGVLAVARPTKAKINGCGKDVNNCSNDDFPLFIYVSSDIIESKIRVEEWTCFNSENETFICIGQTAGIFTEAKCISENHDPSFPEFFNGSLFLLNGSKTTTSIGLLQVGTRAEDGSWNEFLEKMKEQRIEVDEEGGLVYRTLRGSIFKFGAAGNLPYVDEPNTYDSPFIKAAHQADPFSVLLSCPGFVEDETLHFG